VKNRADAGDDPDDDISQQSPDPTSSLNDERSSAGAPPGDDGDSTAVAGVARLREVPPIVVGTVLAERYQIERQLGEGGSGTVYRAWDRMLGESIAIKVLHPQRARERSWIKRLAREVKVARLIRHPNVCRMFELGHADEHWFVTMELATAGSLRERLRGPHGATDAERERPTRPLPERITDLRQVCAGLGALHAIGITHRDVTPQNVLVMADGRLVLTDFGLAIERDDKTTVMGGTPAYMPPEAARGERSDQRSDVFQLGMIMHEVLTGVRPRWTADGSRLALVEPAPNAPASEVELARLISACVDVDPARRPPTALAVAGRLAAAEAAREAAFPLRALGRVTRFARAHALLMKIATAVLALALVARVAQRLARPPLCEGGAAQMAGIWDSRRAEAVRRAFSATGKSYAADAFTHVRNALDGFARDWIHMYTDACQATQLRGEQSAEVLDLRMACLKERSQDLRALADLLSLPDGEAVARSVNAATGLPPISLCADVRTLRAVVPVPANPDTRQKVEALRQRIADLKALYMSARYVDASKRLGDLVAQARAIGYEPLLAEALQIEGALGKWTRPHDETTRVLEEAMLHAEASRHDRVLAETAIDLLSLFLLDRRFDDMERFVPRVRATVARLGGDARLESWIDTAVADSYENRGRYAEALALDRRALALKIQALGPDHWDVALSRGNVAVQLHRLGRDGEALIENQKAIDSLQRAFGSAHLDLALHLSSRGEIHLSLHQPAAAAADFTRALAIWQDELPPGHLYLSYALTGLGQARLATGAPAAALAPLEQALLIREASKADAETRAETMFALAQALWRTERDRPRALRLAEKARDLLPADAAERRPVVAALAEWRADAE
jgi:tetratricopeptide (TPR) repeat protein